MKKETLFQIEMPTAPKASEVIYLDVHIEWDECDGSYSVEEVYFEDSKQDCRFLMDNDDWLKLAVLHYDD